MEIETTTVARQYRLMEWADQIRDCHTIILNICCQKSQIIWMTRIGVFWKIYCLGQKNCRIIAASQNLPQSDEVFFVKILTMERLLFSAHFPSLPSKITKKSKFFQKTY